MISGILAGLLWGVDTVILGIALAMSPFATATEALILAPFVSTFLHDFCSSIWMFIYMGSRQQLHKVWRALKTRSGKFIILGALLGGPIGMSGYVASIYFIGPSYTAIISSLFPAVGAFFSYLFLKEKMQWYQMMGLGLSISCVILLGYTAVDAEVNNLLLGMISAFVCVLGWSLEAVICAYGMKDPEVNDEDALQIRQCTSALFYGVIIITALNAWPMSFEVVQSEVLWFVLASALFGTASYVFYYRSINTIGASKAMALNITYTAWSIVLSFMFLGLIPDVKSVILGLLIIGGSLFAASDIKLLMRKKVRSI